MQNEFDLKWSARKESHHSIALVGTTKIPLLYSCVTAQYLIYLLHNLLQSTETSCRTSANPQQILIFVTSRIVMVRTN